MKTPGIQTAQKLIGIGVLLLTMLPNSRAVSTLPFYEPFGEYAEDENLGSARTNQTSGKVWIFGNTATDSSAKITTNAALSYPGLPAEPNPFPKGIRANGKGKNRGVAFTEQTKGSVYASFLMQVTTSPESPRMIACLSSTNQGIGISTPAAGVYVDASGRLVLTKHREVQQPSLADAPTTKTAVTNKVNLVVISYTFNPDRSSNDVVSLWLNPTALGDNSKVPPPTMTCSTGDNATTLQGFVYMAPKINPSIGLDVDEIRVATDWAGVTSGTSSGRARSSK
jgi:hypothetical protein